MPPDIRDLSKDAPLTEIIKNINARFNSKLEEGRENGRIIKHNLEYGLGAENIFRNLLSEILPSKYGIGKGKIINTDGDLSSHLDVIIYDKSNFPTLFVDENKNLIVPLESIYCVIEIKSKTDASSLKQAFEGLSSIHKLNKKPKIKSLNNLIDYRPPKLIIFSFQDERKLEAIKDNYCRLSDEYKIDYSFSRYSKNSPAHQRDNSHQYLVSGVYILGLGATYAMLDGRVAIGRWAEHTFSMLISGLLSTFSQIDMGNFIPTDYIHWLGAGAMEVYQRET